MDTISLPAALYTASEAARIIGVKRTSIYKMVYEGRIRGEYDQSGALRISPHEVYHYLSK